MGGIMKRASNATIDMITAWIMVTSLSTTLNVFPPYKGLRQSFKYLVLGLSGAFHFFCRLQYVTPMAALPVDLATPIADPEGGAAIYEV